MLVQRVEQIVIKKGHAKFKIIDEMCLKSKDLYNYANYIIRQEFINNDHYIKYMDMNKELKTHQQYKDHRMLAIQFRRRAFCQLHRMLADQQLPAHL